MYGPLRLSFALLANYVPNCRMSSGPHGPIFLEVSVFGNFETEILRIQSDCKNEYEGAFYFLILRTQFVFKKILKCLYLCYEVNKSLCIMDVVCFSSHSHL